MALAVAFAAAVWVRVRAFEGGGSIDEVAEPPVTETIAEGNVPAATGTMAAIPDRTPSGVAMPADSASAREQRYNELLHAPPPEAPSPTPKPASMLDRVAAALGMKSKPPAPAPSSSTSSTQGQGQAQARPRPAGSQAQPHPSRSDVRETPASDPPATDTSRGETDSEADVVPPQVLGAEFVPPQIRDGETTLLSVFAQDNLSGVRSVSGVIASPSGSMQGFACQREGDSNQFIARITIPREAPSGTWRVKYLTLSDNASNSVNLNLAQGSLPPTATFEVLSSTADSTGPVLKAVWLDRLAMRAGDRNTLFVQAEDDQSGVAIVSGTFVSPSKLARIGFGCRAGQTGAWECALTPPKCLDCGLWKLEQIQMQDKANNMTTVRTEHPLVGTTALDISGEACDAAPPALSNLAVNPLVVSNAQDSEIEVRAIIADEGCGVASLSGQAIPPGGIGGQRAFFSLQPSGDGQTFVGKMIIKQRAATGIWTIAWLQALDKGHNLRSYAASDPVLSRVTFRVE